MWKTVDNWGRLDQSGKARRRANERSNPWILLVITWMPCIRVTGNDLCRNPFGMKREREQNGITRSISLYDLISLFLGNFSFELHPFLFNLWIDNTISLYCLTPRNFLVVLRKQTRGPMPCSYDIMGHSLSFCLQRWVALVLFSLWEENIFSEIRYINFEKKGAGRINPLQSVAGPLHTFFKMELLKFFSSRWNVETH